ncbi:MAG: TAXI family TRAP transporter solute-binding subunit [Proteobacteria bacterium]|nr:TAXI family TRAP transporter solute-binding subunit [Pseudomonadota bacterium]
MGRRQLLAGLGCAAALTGGLRPARAQDAQFFRIASGPTESSMFQVATLIGQAVSSPPGARDCAKGGSCGVPGLIVVNQTTAGSLANIDLVAGGKIESALSQADLAYWAFHGSGPWAKREAMRNLRAVANLYPETLHLVVRRGAGVADVKGLRAKTVALGERESGTAIAARAVLQAAGLGERDVKPQYVTAAQAVEALGEGKLDAFFLTAGVPSQVVADLARQMDVVILPLGAYAARLRATQPFLTETVIPAATYRGVPEIVSLSIGIVWIVSEQADEQIVYGLTRALWHPNNRRGLDANAGFGRFLRPESAVDGLGFQLHPGAALYYTESGLVR